MLFYRPTLNILIVLLLLVENILELFLVINFTTAYAWHFRFGLYLAFETVFFPFIERNYFLGGLVKNTLHLFSEFQDQKKFSASGLFLKCS